MFQVTGSIVDFTEEGKNRAKNRDKKDTGMSLNLNWSYAWPMNRRILYNRASCDPNGVAI